MKGMLRAIVFRRIPLCKNHYLFRGQTFATSRSLAPTNIDIGRYALLAVPITTFCLGTWQVKRRKWKLNLIEEVNKKINAPPVELPHNLEELEDMEYQRVHVRGKFDHSQEMYLGPRPILADKDEGGGLFSSPSISGNCVVTPFHLADRDLTILVNRGWVPRNKTDPSKRTEGQIDKEVELIGVVRPHENRPQFCPKSKAGSNQFFFRDVYTMAKISGAAPVIIEADKDSTVPGGPVGGQTRHHFRNEHLSYIFTWYSLSAATTYMWWKMYIRPLKLLK